MNTTKRDYSFDFLKGVLIFLVVWGHVIQILGPESYLKNPLYIWIYSFHMPLFIFISGYFASNSIIQNFTICIQSKIKRLLIPALIWTIIRFITVNIYKINEIGIFQSIYNSFRGIWFLYCLFMLYVIANLIWKSKYKYFIALILIIIGYGTYPYQPIDVLKHFQIIRQWPVFIMGIAYAEYKEYLIQNKKNILFPLFWLSTILYSIWLYFTTIEQNENYLFSSNTYILRGIILIVASITMYFILKLAYQKYKHSTIFHILTKLGNNTLGIYMTNSILLYSIKDIFTIPYICNNILLFIASIPITGICYTITRLIKKNIKLQLYLLGEK